MGAGGRIAWTWLVLPYLLVLVAFLAVPLANLLILSFYTYSAVTLWVPRLTTANYAQVLTPYFGFVALRTLRIGVIATVCCAVIGYPVAYFLARCSRRVLTLGMFVLLLPLMVSAVVGSFGWMVILGRKGVLNGVLATLGLPAHGTVLYTEAAVEIALVHFLLPLMVLPLLASIEKISVRLEEAAANLGAAPLVTFLRVILPLSRPGLVSGALLCFSIAISVVVISALLGGRAGRMMGNEIYEQVVTASNWPFAASLSAVLVAVILVAMGVALGLARPRRVAAR
jgi:ABC-type spermidine/putrescine transport system permease subunit I